MSIQQALASAMSMWLKAKQGRTLNVLTRLTTASYSSIRRAAQGDCEQEQSTVVSIASVVMSEDEFRLFLRKYYPSLELAVADVRGHEVSLDGVADNESAVIDFLKSDDHAKILVLASSRTGTNDEEVTKKFGENYLAYFSDIKESGVLRSFDGNWYFDGSIGNVSLALSRKVLCSLVKEFDARNDSIRLASYSYLLWESLNAESVEKIYKLNERHAKEVYAIASKPENKGDALLVCGLLHNVIKGQESLS